MNKKYFSISEVCGAAGISAHKLRYLETSIVNFKVTQIRNRRYYTEDNILQISKFLNLDAKIILNNLQNLNSTSISASSPTQLSLFAEAPIVKTDLGQKSKEDVISDIDKLLAKLTGLV